MNVNLTCESHPYLDAAIGSSSYAKQFVKKGSCWSLMCYNLPRLSKASPKYIACSAFTKGFASC